MLRSLKEIKGYRIHAKDGDVGTAHDFHFDDTGWFLRYVVVDTGNWLPGKRVLVAPEAFGKPDWEGRNIPVALSRDAVKDAPASDSDRPVSRRQEEALRAFHGWPSWWTAPAIGLALPAATTTASVPAQSATAVADGDPHLRSAREVLSYDIETRDGDLGTVEDIIVDDTTWAVRYLVVGTRKLLPGKKVLVSPAWISDVRWSDGKVRVDLTEEQVKGAPAYDPATPINRSFEEQLYDFLGRPRDWK